MLRWLRKNVPKKYHFLIKIFLVVVVIHILVALIFFMSRGQNVYRLDFKRSVAPVVLLPFQKTVVQKVTVRNRVSNVTQGRSLRSGQKPSTTLVKLKKPAAVKKKKKSVSKKVSKKKHKAQPKAKKPIKKVAQKKSLNNVSVAGVSDKKKNWSVVAKKKVVTKQRSLPQTAKKEPMSSTVSGADDVVYIGQHDLDVLELHDAIRSEIERAWRPPVGLAIGKSCRVKVLVDWSGKIDELSFEESSHVVAFDTSVRHALLKMKFPKVAYGKVLVIPFS